MDYFTSPDGLHRVHLATPETITVVIDVADERIRQVAKWGVQTRPDGTSTALYANIAADSKAHTDRRAAEGTLTWVDILMEEVFEALAEEDPSRLREEMVQVAAVAVSIIEDIDRKAENGPTCSRRVSSAADDEVTYECGRPATVEAFTASGQWEPHCATHVAGWPGDRVRLPLRQPGASS